MRAAGGPAVDAALRGTAGLLRERAEVLLDANRADVEAAGRVAWRGLLDRLRLDPERLAGMAAQIDVLAATPGRRAGARPHAADRRRV